jgi:hypothetical protein
MCAQSIAPRPHVAGWLVHSVGALVVMPRAESRPAEKTYQAPPKENTCGRNPFAANPACCGICGCEEPSCVGPDEHDLGLPHLCRRHFAEAFDV